MPREVRTDADDAVDLPGQHEFLGSPHRGEKLRVEVRGELEAGGHFRRVGRGVLQDHGDRHVLHVERQAVAEQQDQHHRQHDADGDAAGVAEDLTRLLAHQRPDSPRLWRAAGCAVARRPASCAHLLPGAGWADWPCARFLDDRDEGVLHRGRATGSRLGRRRTSAGVPWASTRPASRITMRSQYSASSMKWVVTITVTPCSASAVMRRQNSRRASGSAPLVGSSRNRISGSCSSAAAIASRCL